MVVGARRRRCLTTSSPGMRRPLGVSGPSPVAATLSTCGRRPTGSVEETSRLEPCGSAPRTRTVTLLLSRDNCACRLRSLYSSFLLFLVLLSPPFFLSASLLLHFSTALSLSFTFLPPSPYPIPSLLFPFIYISPLPLLSLLHPLYFMLLTHTHTHTHTVGSH